jgi:hypothetical protein
MPGPFICTANKFPYRLRGGVNGPDDKGGRSEGRAPLPSRSPDRLVSDRDLVVVIAARLPSQR